MAFDYSEIMHTETFQRLAAFLRVASSHQWGSEYPESKFGFYYHNFTNLVRKYHPDLNTDILSNYAGMLTSAIDADIRLSLYITTDVTDWLAGLLSDKDRGHTAAVLMLVLAVSSCADTLLSPVEAAEQSGMSESYWRNAAAGGDVPGAIKKGKQWLIPISWVRYGKE